MMPVELRDIANADDYRVGDDGSFWSRRTSSGKAGDEWHQLKTVVGRDGYVVARIRCNGKTICLRAHRVVLETFVGPAPFGMQACHNNGTKTDNRLVNLRWDSQVNNEADKIIHGTVCIGERHGSCKLTAAQVADVRRERRSGESLKSIADHFGVNPSQVSRIANNKSRAIA